MPYVVTCPECSTRLKTPNPVPAGRAVTCPSCRHAFTTTEESPELADTASAPALPRPPVPPPPPPKKARQEELAATEIVDDDDEDDRPRAKRRRDEDDEDDRPRAKKRRDDDDDDRPPAKRRSRDDDEDDLPASRRKGAKKKKSKLVLILAIALPVLFLMVVGAGVGAYFLFFRGGASSDMLAWAPSSTDSVRGVKYSAISGYPSLKRAAQSQLSRVENLGVTLDTVDEALFATGPAGEAVVVRTKRAMDPAVLMRVSKATEVTANGKKYYKTPGGPSFHLPSSRLLVYCPGETTMTDLLRKDAKVTIGDDLRGYVGKASGDQWEAKVMATRGVPMFGVSPPKAQYGGKSVYGNQMRGTMTLVFADAASAQVAESQLKQFAPLFLAGNFRGVGKKMDTFDVSASGSTVSVTITGPIEDDGMPIFGGF